ncbi:MULTISPECIES: hypothetical protein [Streptomyces]|uniref:hypothetical protein n=1 Tax=Streptomyces TaxID=1883 RepID=UPI000D51B07F|nr:MULTISPECIES: hypothetical protein [Streptomyces]MXG29560.1 hypothetical protein [Streptomyces sp. YIM 132580]MYW28609.1 hypothetical protein [Streptomyces sp. SID2119]NYS18159.1 hypothetical protein [Streptomyces sp. SJ1-7]PVC78296.1 hypothetical protein DBP15_05680 [Streptomyces sp. CS065A]
MGQRYYVDPQRIESETRQLEEIGKLARSMTEEFLDDLAPTISWPGTNSEFSEKARPQEQKERQITKDTVMAVQDAVMAITDATLSNVRMMQETRDRNIEEIDRNNNRLDADGLGGPGRYGRR